MIHYFCEPLGSRKKLVQNKKKKKSFPRHLLKHQHLTLPVHQRLYLLPTICLLQLHRHSILFTLNHQDKLSKLGQKSNPPSSIIAWSLRRNRLRPVYNPCQKCSPVSAGFVVTSRSILGRRKSGPYLVPVPILHTKILSYAPSLRYRHATNLCTVAVFIVEHSYVDAHVGRVFGYARNVPKFGA